MSSFCSHVAAIRPNDEKAIAYFRTQPGNATAKGMAAAAGNGNEGMKTASWKWQVESG